MSKWEVMAISLLIFVLVFAGWYFTSQWWSCIQAGGVYVEAVNAWPKCVEAKP